MFAVFGCSAGRQRVPRGAVFGITRRDCVPGRESKPVASTLFSVSEWLQVERRGSGLSTEYGVVVGKTRWAY